MLSEKNSVKVKEPTSFITADPKQRKARSENKEQVPGVVGEAGLRQTGWTPWQFLQRNDLDTKASPHYCQKNSQINDRCFVVPFLSLLVSRADHMRKYWERRDYSVSSHLDGCISVLSCLPAFALPSFRTTHSSSSCQSNSFKPQVSSHLASV